MGSRAASCLLSNRRPPDRLDRSPRTPRGFRDRPILRLDDRLCRLVAVEAGKFGQRDLTVRRLRPVLIDDIEQREAVRPELLDNTGHLPLRRIGAEPAQRSLSGLSDGSARAARRLATCSALSRSFASAL